MEYLFLIHSDENAPVPAPGEPGFDEMMAAWMAYNQSLIESGNYVDGAMLHPTSTATIVTLATGVDPVVSDGPFIETKEQFGGYYLVDAPDLDEALALAARIPIPFASIEVRPVSLHPGRG